MVEICHFLFKIQYPRNAHIDPQRITCTKLGEKKYIDIAEDMALKVKTQKCQTLNWSTLTLKGTISSTSDKSGIHLMLKEILFENELLQPDVPKIRRTFNCSDIILVRFYWAGDKKCNDVMSVWQIGDIGELVSVCIMHSQLSKPNVIFVPACYQYFMSGG